MSITQSTSSEEDLTLKSIEAKVNRGLDKIYCIKSKTSELEKK